MSEVKRYEISGTFNVPEIGEKLVNPKMVLESDFDRVTAERDAALEDLRLAKQLQKTTDAIVMMVEGQRDHWIEKCHALQQRLTAADERADVLETETKRLNLMVSQADYNYDADRMQFKASIDLLEGLLREAESDGVSGSLILRIRAALKPAEAEPYQGIPGTSFQRLNALANQGE